MNMGHLGSRGGGRGGLGELTRVGWPATGVVELGLLLDCDRFLGITGLCCGVMGGFLTEGVLADSESSELKGVYSVEEPRSLLYLLPFRRKPLCSSKSR